MVGLLVDWFVGLVCLVFRLGFASTARHFLFPKNGFMWERGNRWLGLLV